MSGSEIQAWHEHPSGTALMKSWSEVKVSSVGPLALWQTVPTLPLLN